MLDVIELNTLFEKLGTPDAGRKLVRQAQIKAPVRQVQSRGNNVHVLFNSQKMGCVLECESHRVEFPFAVMLENDPKVLEYYLQPCELHVAVQGAGGRLARRRDCGWLSSKRTPGCPSSDPLRIGSDKRTHE